MTIQELYEWALKNKCEDLTVVKAYEDAGGGYSGGHKVRESNICFASGVVETSSDKNELNEIVYVGDKKFLVI